MKQTVVGVFDHYAEAQKAANLLEERGIDADCIRVTSASGETLSDATPSSSTTPAHEEGVLASVRNFFADLFGSEDHDDVNAYSEAVRRGGAVVKVDVDEDPQVDLAREVLQSAGAVDIDERLSSWGASGGTTTEGSAAARREDGDTARDDALLRKRTTSREDTARPAGGSAEEVIPVVRESIEIGKRTVQAGGVRVYARAVEEPVRENVELREERAVVERRPADREVTGADLDAGGERSIEVTESVERPVVQKSARVVEEVVVGKEVRTQQATIEDTLRHTEVEVEQLGGSRLSGEAGSRVDEDDDLLDRRDFDSRFAREGGRFEDWQPAYRYGRTVRTDARYQGRSWDEVEPDLERDWARRYPDSPWQRMKAAVRHAWDRVTD